jgi:protein-tyrosine-phosphatase/DNA-binding transcriptional ArsR family regulator
LRPDATAGSRRMLQNLHLQQGIHIQYPSYIWILDIASNILATLGHPGRLAIFRLLMRFAPQGVRPTEIAAALGIRQNTLSAQLAELERAGLVSSDRDGRSIYYRAMLPLAADLMSFLANDCCKGRPDICFSKAAASKEPALTARPFNVLFICSGNSARSIFAEALLRDLGAGRFVAHSAGSRPGSALNTLAVQLLKRNGHSVEGLRSKHLWEFELPDAPRMDFVFTVCNTAATEECPPWPGQPLTAHWQTPKPVAHPYRLRLRGPAFPNAYADLRRRILAFTSLPFAELEKVALQTRLDAIGNAE